MSRPGAAASGLLTTAEVAAAFYLDRSTVQKWARSGKLASIRTLGGHRRYRRAQVEALLRGRPPRIGESGPCPDCGRPAHYVSHDAHRGWYHDVIARQHGGTEDEDP